MDESVNVIIAQALRRRGIEAVTVKDAGRLGFSDEEQLEYAREGNYVIVTHDDDFLSLAENIKHKGIIYVHQQKYGIGEIVRKLALLWDVVEQKDMKNHVEFL